MLRNYWKVDDGVYETLEEACELLVVTEEELRNSFNVVNMSEILERYDSIIDMINMDISFFLKEKLEEYSSDMASIIEDVMDMSKDNDSYLLNIIKYTSNNKCKGDSYCLDIYFDEESYGVKFVITTNNRKVTALKAIYYFLNDVYDITELQKEDISDDDIIEMYNLLLERYSETALDQSERIVEQNSNVINMSSRRNVTKH